MVTASIIYNGAACYSAAILVSIIARTDKFDDAEHLEFTPGLF